METGRKQQKQVMRKMLKAIRCQLEETYIKESDRRITQRIIEFSKFRQARVVFCFVNIENEINTRPILIEALKQNKHLVVPKCLKNGQMEVRQITSLAQLEPGVMGILEPVEACPKVGSEEIDFAIVPCLTCDLDGRRLGYGGGFYDYYLQGRTYVAAVICREKLLVEQVPTEEWDQVMDVVVTENRVKEV